MSLFKPSSTLQFMNTHRSMILSVLKDVQTNVLGERTWILVSNDFYIMLYKRKFGFLIIFPCVSSNSLLVRYFTYDSFKVNSHLFDNQNQKALDDYVESLFRCNQDDVDGATTHQCYPTVEDLVIAINLVLGHSSTFRKTKYEEDNGTFEERKIVEEQRKLEERIKAEEEKAYRRKRRWDWFSADKCIEELNRNKWNNRLARKFNGFSEYHKTIWSFSVYKKGRVIEYELIVVMADNGSILVKNRVKHLGLDKSIGIIVESPDMMVEKLQLAYNSLLNM